MDTPGRTAWRASSRIVIGGGTTIAGVALLVGLLSPTLADAGLKDGALRIETSMVLNSAHSALVFDVNGDGRDDLFLKRHELSAGTDQMLIGTRYGFVDQTRSYFPGSPGQLPVVDRHGCAIADVDQNGHDDIYCAIGANRGSGGGTNELWLFDGRHFALADDAWGASDQYGRGRWPAFFDVNGDDRPDLLVTNEQPRHDQIAAPNRLFLNTGSSFVSAPEYGLDLELNFGSLDVADLDDDGQSEVILAEYDYQTRATRRLRVFRQPEAGAPFEDVGEELFNIKGHWRNAITGDFDNDGALDTLLLRPGKVKLRLQGANGWFSSEWSYRIPGGGGYRLAVNDVNGDGNLDAYVVRRSRDCYTFTPTNNYPDLLLLGKGNGRFAVLNVPTSAVGCGAWAEPYEDGFLVLNGGQVSHGPMQLVFYDQ